MDSRSIKFKAIIEAKFGTVKHFAVTVGIPYTTLRSGLQNGIGGMAFDKVMLMCDALDIDPHTFDNNKRS